MSDKIDFSTLEKSLADYTRAIGHPARVAILLEMARRGNRISGEILDIANLSKSTVLQHLRELKKAGFIHGRIFGVKSEYYLNQDHFVLFNETFHSFMQSFNSFEKK